MPARPKKELSLKMSVVDQGLIAYPPPKEIPHAASEFLCEEQCTGSNGRHGKITSALKNEKGINDKMRRLVKKKKIGRRNSFMNRDAQNQVFQMHLTWPLEYQFIRTCRSEADDEFNIQAARVFCGVMSNLYMEL